MELTQYPDSFVNSKLVIAAILIDETSEYIEMAINAINDGKHGIINPRILPPAILKSTLQEFEKKHRSRHHFDTHEINYQHIVEIIQLSVAVIGGLLSYILRIPIIENEEMKRIIPIPHPVQNLYCSINPNHDYVIKYRDSYVITDLDTIEKCKTIAEYKICERNQSSVKLLDSETCEASLFKRYPDNKCKPSPFSLHKETFISISDGYIVIPIKEIKLDINCENFIKQDVISKPSLLRGSNCKIYNDYDTLYLKETIQISTIEQFNVTYNIKYSWEDLDNLKNQFVQLPKLIDKVELQRARLSLDDSENTLQNIAQNRRVKTGTKTSLEYLSYLGYTVLALGILYLAYTPCPTTYVIPFRV